ncbi:hypothetical protein BH09ACT11_BH09ACT11_03100 [soil metagenome]
MLVSHDGSQWIPTILDAISAQTVPLETTIAVDTGSRDNSAELLEASFDLVLHESGRTSFPQAVDLALEHTDAEWLWLLHDDSTPAPTALAELLSTAQAHPEVDIFGPKLREWPSLRRLLEVGVTITGTGRRHTGLERGETDQGQHDQARRVLAVNTAGMLVRRCVLVELGGLDQRLPMFGNDIDLGWRAANAGHATMVVPSAVVFHLEAAHRGVRSTPLTGRHTHFAERRAALYTLLVNSPGWTLPWKLMRLTLGTLLRMLGFFLVRSPGEAFDELAALLNIWASPRELIAARRSRTHRSGAGGLLAPWWLPYRIGMDFVSDVVAALSNQASDVAERRRIAAAEADPASFAAQAQRQASPDDEDEMLSDSGWLARLNPVMVLLGLAVVIGLICARDAIGAVVAPGLSPAPTSSPGWFGLHFASWHPIEEGSSIPAPGYVFFLAVAGLPFGAQATITAIMMFAFPFSVWGAWRLLRVLGRLASPRGAPRWLMLWGSVTWALVPVMTDAWGEGRLGTVVVAALLPWLLHASLGFAEPEADRRWRAGWRSGFLLSLAVAFTPVIWPIGALLAAVALGLAAVLVPGGARQSTVWGPPFAALATPLVLLSPWWLPMVYRTGGAGLLLEAGRVPGASDILAPWWFTATLLTLAVASLVPRATRIPVVVCWIVAVVALVVTMLVSLIPIGVRGGTAPAGVAVGVVVAHGACLVACLFGVQGGLAARKPRWWRIPAAVIVGLAAVVPVMGLGSWLVQDNALSDPRDSSVPAYMREQAELAASDGIAIITGSVADGLTYSIQRGDGPTVGEDEIRALTPTDTAFEDVLTRVVSEPTPAVMGELSRHGVRYIVMPAPADPHVAEEIDASGGVRRTSAADRTTPAWQLNDEPLLESSGRDWVRTVLLAIQITGLVIVLALCLPTVRAGRSRGPRPARRSDKVRGGAR